MASRQDVELAFQRSGIGRGPTESEINLFSAFPDAGRIEGDVRRSLSEGRPFGSTFSGSGPSFSSSFTPSINVRTSTGQSFDPIQTARQLLSFQQEAAKPAIAGLEAQREPLKQRYQALIDEIKGKSKRAVEQTETRLSREFGQRGIPLSSDVFQRQLQEEQLATEEPFVEQQRLTEAGRELDLANIATQIAQLQAGQPATASEQALNLLATQIAASKPQELQTEVITAGGRKKLINRQTGEVIADLGASTEGTSGSNLLADIQALREALNPEQITPSSRPPISTFERTSGTSTSRKGGFGTLPGRRSFGFA